MTSKEELVDRLIQRFVLRVVHEEREIAWQNLEDILSYVKEHKCEVYCDTIAERYLLARYARGKVKINDEIVRQAKMYADFGKL